MNSEKVLEIFKEITRIPRESGHEEPMTAYLQQFAKDRNLECRTDKIGNVCIVKEASAGNGGHACCLRYGRCHKGTA